MDKLALAKLAIKVVVGIGVSHVAKQIISTNVAVEDTEDKIKVAVGTIVIGMMVADMTSAYTDAKIGQIVRIWQAQKLNIERAKLENLDAPAA